MTISHTLPQTSASIVATVAAAILTTSASTWLLWKTCSYNNATKKRLTREDFNLSIPRKFFSLGSSLVCIQNVRIPISTLPKDFFKEGDEEGLVDCHVQIDISNGKISAIGLANDPQTQQLLLGSNVRTIEGRGCLFLPCFVDAHTHLTKTQTVPRLRNSTGTWGEALLVLEPLDEAKYWSNLEDVQRRMDFALQCAWHYGTKAIRTHLDGCASPNESVLVETVYQAYDNMVQKYKARPYEMTLQGVANLYLPLWLQEPMATKHADRAAQHENVVLGAYVGNPTTQQEKDDTLLAMKALLQHAQRLDHMDVDLHIDESNDPACCNLLSLIEALDHARQNGYQGNVVLGHCCSLSLQSKETQTFICQHLARLKKVHVVANPITNLGLQDRRGSVAPQSVPIPSEIPRTPQWRGMTLVQELQAAGVSVSMASDNVRDHWNPFGDYDLLAAWAMGIQMGHLDTVPSPGAWAHLVTCAPAEAMGLTSRQDSHCFAVGEPADGILFPQARRFSELLARPQTNRILLRKGIVQQNTALPDFADLDDLVGSVNK